MAAVVVFHPRYLPASADGFSGWIYADENPELYEQVQHHFASVAPAVPPRRFQEEATSRRAAFVAWTDANLRGSAVEEWLSTPLHRCTFPSPAPPIFLHSVWLSLIDRQLEQSDGALAVVTCHQGLSEAIRRLAGRRQVPFRLVGRGAQWREAVRIRMRSLAALGKAATDITLRILLSRVFLGKDYLRRLRQTEVLIDTYLHGTDLDADGTFHDRYFPGLARWYLDIGVKVAIYPFLFRLGYRELPRVYRAIYRSAVPMAPFERFVGPADLLRALGRSLRIAMWRRSTCTSLEGIDMTPLLPLPGFASAASAFLPLLMLQAPAGMARRGIRPACVLDWHENQPIDKATTYGFQHVSPPCRVIGMRQYVPVPNYLSEYSTPAEVADGVAPAEHWVCGPALPNLLETYGAKARYRVVPALRFAHLYEAGLRGRSGADLLILLTHSIFESVQILALVFESLEFCKGFGQIVVKPQPNVPKTATAIRRIAERRWPALFAAGSALWSVEPMPQLLASARLVVSSGTSAALEAVCRGVPVIMAGNLAGLDAVPLAGVDTRIWRLVYGREDFQVALDALSDEGQLSEAIRTEIADKTRSQYFTPTNATTLRGFDWLTR